VASEDLYFGKSQDALPVPDDRDARGQRETLALDAHGVGRGAVCRATELPRAPELVPHRETAQLLLAAVATVGDRDAVHRPVGEIENQEGLLLPLRLADGTQFAV
jgi:hypothetical protein